MLLNDYKRYEERNFRFLNEMKIPFTRKIWETGKRGTMNTYLKNK
jgi:hypothetical protein